MEDPERRQSSRLRTSAQPPVHMAPFYYHSDDSEDTARAKEAQFKAAFDATMAEATRKVDEDLEEELFAKATYKASKKGFTNHDYCDGCFEGGELLCCDDCPASYHLFCLDPPLMTIPEGDWSCKKCLAKPKFDATAQKTGGIFGPLILQLEVTNPRAFTLPTMLDRRMKAGRSASPKSDEPAKRNNDLACFSCKGLLDPSDNREWVPCSRCVRSYHLYCLEPALYKQPAEGWWCDKHKRLGDPAMVEDRTPLPKNRLVVPEEVIPLDFFPYEMMPEDARPNNRRVRRLPTRALQGSDKVHVTTEERMAEHLIGEHDKAQAALADEEMVDAALEGEGARDMAGYMTQVQKRQQSLMVEAMGGELALGANGPFGAVTPSMMAAFTPLFTQFLAWQRLMTLNEHVVDMREHVPAAAAASSADVEAARAKRADKESLEVAAAVMSSLPTADKAAPASAESLYQSFYKEAYTAPTGAYTPEAYQAAAAAFRRRTKHAERTREIVQHLHVPEPGEEELLGELTVKRKRGRPRKKPYTGKPRGRPRKADTVDDAMDVDFEGGSGSANSRRRSNERATRSQSVSRVNNAAAVHITAYIWSGTPEVEMVPARFEFENVLPLSIGRSGEDADDLHLNMCKFSTSPLVRKVSHNHMRVVGQLHDPASLFIVCLGRNGMLVDGVQFKANQQAALAGETMVRAGPFHIKLVVTMETPAGTAKRVATDREAYGDVYAYPIS